MKSLFQFLSPGKLVDGDLELVLVRTQPADPVKRYVPAYYFAMRHATRGEEMGHVSLRIGSARALRYPGHIGYKVHPEFRGHRYAARSCALLLPFLRVHGLKAVWLTTGPDNIASQRTMKLIGARYMETVPIARSHEMYHQGKRQVQRYRLDRKSTRADKLLTR